MRHRLMVILILLTTAVSLGFAMPELQLDSAGQSSLIREEKSVSVRGVKEIWRLQWRTAPKMECPPAKNTSFNCLCQPFAYAESGELDLVRLRNGVEFERMSLGPLFDAFEPGKAVIQRWPVQDDDSKNALKRGADEEWQKSEAVRIQKRSVVQVMKMGDYNHDGNATEFYLPTTSIPCGKNAGVVIGISPDNDRLHGLGTMQNPNVPLVLKKWEWEALLKSSRRQTVMDWQCDDHGATEETELELETIRGGIYLMENYYQCPRVGKGNLLRSESH
jgi:hypothetical protein